MSLKRDTAESILGKKVVRRSPSCRTSDDGLDQAFVGSAGNEQDYEDDDFTQHIRRKSSRFYIGGFKPSITEMKLCSYVQRRGFTYLGITYVDTTIRTGLSSS